MKVKRVIQILVIFVFPVLPEKMLFGTDDRNYYNELAVSRCDKGDIDNAISAWGKTIIVNPKFVETYYNLGNAYSVC
jgi:tetratricopeptide (TPR) repeat protein